MPDDFEKFKEKVNREFDEAEKPKNGCLTEFIIAMALLFGVQYCHQLHPSGQKPPDKRISAKHQIHTPS
jgi:hypothetical protein